MPFAPSFLSRALLPAAPLLVLLGSCVGSTQQRPVESARPAPRPSPRPAPPVATPAPAPVATEWQYRPASQGSWRYSADSAGSSASFGPAPGDTRFAIRCDRAARTVRFTRAGTAQGAMVVRTSYGAVSWAASPTGTPVMTIATRAASDPTLDQIAYSRGRFAIELGGLETLYLPAWGEVSRVIEDCRG